MNNKVIIFDFDGTIADSLSVAFTAYNEIADHYGLKKLQETERELLRTKGTRAVLSFLDISLFQLPFVAYALRKKYHEYIDQIKPFAGIQEALTSLKDTGCRLALLTSNNKKNVESFFTTHKFPKFDIIKVGSGVFGKHTNLEEIVKMLGCKKSDAVYVGDEVRDIVAAKKAGIASIAVTWGFNARDILAKESPNSIIAKIRSLEKSIFSLFS